MSFPRTTLTVALSVAAAGSLVAAGTQSAGAAPSAPAVTAAAPAAAAPATRDVVLHNPYVAKDRLAKGWTVTKKASAADLVGFSSLCKDPSVSAQVRNTYDCGGSAAYAVACYAKPGYTNVLTCIMDPFTRTLGEYRTAKPLPKTPAPAAKDRRPIGAVLATGNRCHLRSGGAWSTPDDVHVGWAWCESRDKEALNLWQRRDGSGQYRMQGRTVQYLAGHGSRGSALRWVNVTTRYWLG